MFQAPDMKKTELKALHKEMKKLKIPSPSPSFYPTNVNSALMGLNSMYAQTLMSIELGLKKDN